MKIVISALFMLLLLANGAYARLAPDIVVTRENQAELGIQLTLTLTATNGVAAISFDIGRTGTLSEVHEILLIAAGGPTGPSLRAPIWYYSKRDADSGVEHLCSVVPIHIDTSYLELYDLYLLTAPNNVNSYLIDLNSYWPQKKKSS